MLSLGDKISQISLAFSLFLSLFPRYLGLAGYFYARIRGHKATRCQSDVCLKLINIDTSGLCARCIDVTDHLHAAFIYSAMKSTTFSYARMNVYRTYERAAAKHNRQFVSHAAWRYGIFSAVGHSQAIIDATPSHIDVRVSVRLLCSRKILIQLISRRTYQRRGTPFIMPRRECHGINKASRRLFCVTRFFFPEDRRYSLLRGIYRAQYI